MANRFIRENGIRNYPNDVIDTLRKAENVSLGVGLAQMLEHTGHTYKEAAICSFMELSDAFPITMTNTESLTFLTGPMDRAAEGGVVLVNEYAFGNGAAYPQPNGQFDLLCGAHHLLSFSMKKTDHLYQQNGVRAFFQVKKSRFATGGDQFTLDEYIQAESTFVNGLLYLYLPPETLRDLPVPLSGDAGRLTLTVKPFNPDACSRRWFRLGQSPFTLMTDLHGGIDSVLHGIPRPQIGGKHVYFGDIHVHSGDTTYFDDTGCGRKSVADNLAYARDVAGCDFAAVTDHDWQMNPGDWRRLREATEAANDEGRFVALHAFEWTSSNYGHRNVYFRGVPDIPEGLTPFDFRAKRTPVKYGGSASEADPTPDDLHAWLAANKLEAFTVPHHPNAYQFPMDLTCFYNEQYDRAVEIYSNWGSMMDAQDPLNRNVERIGALDIRHYMESGLHFAFIASSDSHDGNGGDSNVSHYKRQFAHDAGSGLVAVPADTLTRESLYEAIYNRHCYAVTGARILLCFRINGAEMGDVLSKPVQALTVSFEVIGEAPLASVTLLHNGEAAQQYTPGSKAFAQTTTLPPLPGWYWLQVKQADGEMAWSSPIWYEPKSVPNPSVKG